MNTPEQAPRPVERRENEQNQLEALASRRLEEIQGSREQGQEDDPQQRVESAREKLERNQPRPEEPVPAAERETPQPGFAARLSPALNYRQTMETLQKQLPAASRAFSKLIHQPAVERASEALEKTVMRPSVTAGATTSAIIIGGIFYVAARIYGFELSGSEIIFAVIIGGLIGYALETAGRFGSRRRR